MNLNFTQFIACVWVGGGGGHTHNYFKLEL
jgi:hypothetical protein